MSLNKKLPLIITKGNILFPNFVTSLGFKKEYLSEDFIKNFQNSDLNVIITSSFEEDNFEKTREQKKSLKKLKILEYGTFASVGNIVEKEDTINIFFNGLKRVKIVDFIEKSPGNFLAEFTDLKDVNVDSNKSLELKGKIRNLILQRMNQLKLRSDNMEPLFQAPAGAFSDSIANILHLTNAEKFELISENNVEKRLEILLDNLQTSLQVNEDIARDINTRVREKFTKQQKEFYLREQLKAIREELDEMSGEENDIKTLKKRAEQNPYPENIKSKILKEIGRLENTPNSAPEAGIIRTYLDWIMNVPWWQKDNEKIDIVKAKKILDEDHYGLEEPKKRIIEYLAVKQSNPDSKGAIISLIGPPGTGKTSLSKSIARALDRKFIKISLGGIKDESEIRGHRRTYIASMPGKIIQAMRKAGATNPVILLDEIDKMSTDFRGDPASAMLEVLDYEQNSKFQDHYLEEEYDLSNVFFLATANYVKDIPEPLYDRLEKIEITSYTELEKTEIAKKFLVPRVINETNLKTKNFKIDDDTLKFIIRHYTMEAGVRQLHRTLEKIARGILVMSLDGELKSNGVYKINKKHVVKLLGKIIFNYTKKEDVPQIGTVNGLAWTAYGGDILPIEVTLFPGKGNLILTGQIKDVMKESASIAYSYIKSNYKKFDIKADLKDNKNIFKDFDVHVHSPDGATPKDGPSAGVTFTTSLISALRRIPVSEKIGMTGEITLRGKILPIGGLREKSISAYRSGLESIYIPKENLRDIDTLPKEITKNLKIIPVATFDELYRRLKKDHRI